MRGRRDSNSQPQDRQSCALTSWATPPMPVTGLAPVTLGLWCPCSTIELHRPKFVAPVGVEPTAPAYETGEITVSPRRVVLLYYKKDGESTPHHHFSSSLSSQKNFTKSGEGSILKRPVILEEIFRKFLQLSGPALRKVCNPDHKQCYSEFCGLLGPDQDLKA